MKFWNPIESKEQAEKSIRNSILGLFGFAILQVVTGLFFWWLTIQSTPISLGFALTVTALIFLALGIAMYFSNSPVIGGILLLVIIFEAISWLNRGSATGDFSVKGVQIIMILILAQALATVMRVSEWKKKGGDKLHHSKIVPIAISVTSVIVIAGFLIPPVHFWYHTRKVISIIENAGLVHYSEPLDKYSFDFPSTWRFEQPALQYGDVLLNPEGNDSASVYIERWTPWSIPAMQLFSADAFLKFAQDEANSYSKETGATIESVEMLPIPKINEARVVYTESDGTKRYVYYVYNRGWSRQTSDAAFFFWRITAVVPRGFDSYDKDVETIMSSFRVN